MVFGCGAKTVKCLVIFFNLLSFVAGLAILITCVVGFTRHDALTGILDAIKKTGVDNIGKVSSVNVILGVGMFVGACLIVLGFLGCCGGLTESCCLLTTFAAILGVVIIIEFAIAIAMLGFKGKIQGLFADGIDKLANETLSSEEDKKKLACQAFDDMFKLAKCCGSKSFDDVKTCGDAYQFAKECKVPAIAEKGCRDEVWTYMWSKAKTFGIVGIIMLILELAAIAFAVVLICAMRRGESLYQSV